jgi:hypothetical protein
MKKNEICPVCNNEVLHTLKIHNSVWHEKKGKMIECKFCNLQTPSWSGHFMLFHEKEWTSDGGRKTGSVNNALKCGMCNVSSIYMEWHLDEVHKIVDCRFCKTAMTNIMKHSCAVYGKIHQKESTYCHFCSKWIEGMTRLEYVDHLEGHMEIIEQGFRSCNLCYVAFPDYDKAQYLNHSCGEARRSKKGTGTVMCGRCFESAGSLAELNRHFQDVHWLGNKGTLTQAEIDFEKAKDDRSKFPCHVCRVVFKDGFEWDSHICKNQISKNNKTVTNVLQDVASKLKNIGKPDASGGVVMIQCIVCGNKSFPDKASYDKHACRIRAIQKKRVAILVSPERDDKTHMDLAASLENAKECLIYTRGIPAEDYLLVKMRENGCTVVSIGAENPSRRDQTLAQQSDIILAFPSKKDTKGREIKQGSMTVGGIKTPVIVYPDCVYVQPLQPQEATAGAVLDACSESTNTVK